MKNFESFLAPQLNDFIVYRESLGYNTGASRASLLVFDRYLRQTNADWDSFLPFYFLEMRANLEMEPSGVNHVFSSVRVFFNFLLRREYVVDNPLQDIPPLKENTIRLSKRSASIRNEGLLEIRTSPSLHPIAFDTRLRSTL